MPSYTAPVKDTQFILHEVLKVTASGIPGYADLEADFTGAVLEEAGKICSEVLAPLNWIGDQNPSHLLNGEVIATPGFKEAFKKFGEYRPFNIGDITNIMSKRTIEKIDHHGDD